MNIFKLLVFITCFLISGWSFAHDANVATFNLRHVNQKQWMFEVMTPLYNLDKSLRKTNQQVPAANLQDTKYKQAIVAYIKNEFNIEACDVKALKTSNECVSLTLGKGKLQLNQHLSVLVFEINGMPNKVQSLEFTIANMAENQGQTNIFRLIDGSKTERFILTEQNAFSGSEIQFFNLAKELETSQTSD